MEKLGFILFDSTNQYTLFRATYDTLMLLGREGIYSPANYYFKYITGSGLDISMDPIN